MQSLPHLTVVETVKLFTSVPHKFVDDFFSLYDIKNADGPIINLKVLSKWIKVPKVALLRTLKESYKLNVDYTVKSAPLRREGQKYGGNRHKEVLITPDCMKRLCMRSRAAMAETVRTYFIEIENFIIKYNDQIVDGLMRDIQDMARKERNKNDGPGVIYIFRASKEHSNMYKLGATQDLVKRLRTYNTGRYEDVELLSIYKTEYRKEVERCVKRLMKSKQYKMRREIYHVDWAIIQKMIAGCAQLSLKLHKTVSKSVMDGEYYMIFTSDIDENK